MDIVKTAGIGICAVLFALILKNARPEFATVINLACGVIIFFAVVTKLEELLGYVTKMFDFITVDEAYFLSILKMLGITYMAEFSASLCKDAGFSGIAGQIQMFAKVSILVLSAPILFTFLSTIGEFL